jgi:hypothetical protein
MLRIADNHTSNEYQEQVEEFEWLSRVVLAGGGFAKVVCKVSHAFLRIIMKGAEKQKGSYVGRSRGIAIYTYLR